MHPGAVGSAAARWSPPAVLPNGSFERVSNGRMLMTHARTDRPLFIGVKQPLQGALLLFWAAVYR
eukprot:414584-Alexandrium_andersonii.AAC.1